MQKPQKESDTSKNTKNNQKKSKKQKKETISQALGKVLPKEFIPTSKTGWVFGGIFIIVVVWGIINIFLSMGSLMAGNLDLSFSIGWPYTFFEMSMDNFEELPIKFGGLVIDLLLYLLFAYIIDVVINVFIIHVLNKKEEVETLGEKESKKDDEKLKIKLSPQIIENKKITKDEILPNLNKNKKINKKTNKIVKIKPVQKTEAKQNPTKNITKNNQTKLNIDFLMNKAYNQANRKNKKEAIKIYNQIKNIYKNNLSKSDKNKTLYNRIVKLYNSINKI